MIDKLLFLCMIAHGEGSFASLCEIGRNRSLRELALVVSPTELSILEYRSLWLRRRAGDPVHLLNADEILQKKKQLLVQNFDEILYSILVNNEA